VPALVTRLSTLSSSPLVPCPWNEVPCILFSPPPTCLLITILWQLYQIFAAKLEAVKAVILSVDSEDGIRLFARSENSCYNCFTCRTHPSLSESSDSSQCAGTLWLCRCIPVCGRNFSCLPEAGSQDTVCFSIQQLFSWLKQEGSKWSVSLL